MAKTEQEIQDAIVELFDERLEGYMATAGQEPAFFFEASGLQRLCEKLGWRETLTRTQEIACKHDLDSVRQ
jgi:hypothetical protein